MGIVSIAVRSGICVYAVKYTVDQGAWGNADKALKFKNDTCKAVNDVEFVKTGKAHFQAYVPVPELPVLPGTSELGFVTTHYYNRAVKSTIRTIKMLPCYAGQGIKYVSNTVKKAMDQPAQS